MYVTIPSFKTQRGRHQSKACSANGFYFLAQLFDKLLSRREVVT